jgi:hypothetical protein
MAHVAIVSSSRRPACSLSAVTVSSSSRDEVFLRVVTKQTAALKSRMGMEGGYRSPEADPGEMLASPRDTSNGNVYARRRRPLGPIATVGERYLAPGSGKYRAHLLLYSPTHRQQRQRRAMDGRRIQIRPQPHRFSFARAKVHICQALNGRVSLYYRDSARPFQPSRR